jgi:PAS domain S-box-containing protein
MAKEPRASSDLRRRATEILRGRETGEIGGVATVDDLKLLHELQVHQIELELQNEELQRAHAGLAAARDRYLDLYDFAPFAYLTLELDGRIRELNLDCAACLGVARAEAVGKLLDDFIEPSDRTALGQFLSRLESATKTQSCQVTLRGGHAARTMRIAGSRISGEPACRAILVDVTETYREGQIALELERRLASASEERYAAILDAALIGVITIDEKFRITEFNHEAERIFGYSADSMVGASLDALVPADLRSIHMAHLADFAGQESRNQHMGSWRQIRGIRSDGQPIPLDAVISKVTIAGMQTMTIIFRDMSDIAKVEGDLKASLVERGVAVDRAEAANRAKSTFLAVMSHELRTPLNAVIGFSDMILSGMFGPEENPKYREYLADINRSGKELLSLISDILDLSRIEAGRFELDVKPVDLVAVWADLVSTLRAATKGRKIAIFGPGGEESVVCSTDRRAILQILTNLVGNAVKFTPDGGEIRVSFHADQVRHEVILAVRDTGRGIASRDIEEIMKPFFQVDRSPEKADVGVGLGLAICKALVSSLKGRIEIESEVGVGTVVTIVLPGL